MNRPLTASLAALAFSAAAAAPAWGAAVVFEAAGADAAAIQAKVDQFRTALGPSNPPGNPQPTGRREVNWDGVPATSLDPFPGAFFNTNSPRGLVLGTPGSRLKVSGDSGTPSFLMKDVTAQAWGETEFATFSPQKLFAPVGSTVTEVVFFVAGTQTRAGVSGFGAVFVDVDAADASRLEAFDAGGNLLFSRAVLPSGAASKGLSFLGVQFDAGERIARVRLTSGNAPIDTAYQTPPPDGVALDDFIYSEPQALAEPLGTSYWIGGAPRGPGNNDSRWRTTLSLHAASGAPAQYELRYYLPSGLKTSSGSVAGGGQRTFDDVVGLLTGDQDAVAPLEVVSDVPLSVGFTVVNDIPAGAECYPGAGFSFAGPAFGPGEPLPTFGTAFISQLEQSPRARANVAVTNTSGAPAKARVSFVRGDGTAIGSYDVELAAYQWTQEASPLSAKFGESNVSGVSARVDVLSGSGVVAYATVIDNQTNDPIYLPARR